MQAIDALLGARERGITRPATVLPTGAGKTIIFAEMIRRLSEEGRRSLVVVHGETLVQQNHAKITMVSPSSRVGIVQAGRDDVNADVVVGSVDTLRNPARLRRLGSFDGVIVDECHHAVADSYRSVLEGVGSFDATPTYGFTATMLRSDSKHLGDVWEDVVFTRSIQWMIKNGYLVDPHGLTVDVPDLDMPSLRRGQSDYSDSAVATAITDSSAAQRVVDAWLESDDARGRKTVVFAPNKAVAALFADTFNTAGVTAEVVLGETPAEERAAMYRRLRNGQTQVLASCGVLLEGWDEPCVSCGIIARLTESQGLYVQMVGRVLRLFPGKKDALVMDVVGSSARHSLKCLADLSESRKEKDEVKDGETLSEAMDRWDEETEDWVDPLVMPEEAELKLRPVDLFADADGMWLQTDVHSEGGMTYGGTWFCASPKRYYFLWEMRDGTYNIRSTESAFRLGRPKLHGEGVDLEFAMTVVEALVSDEETSSGFRSGKSASWRRGNQRPTQKQISYADRVGALLRENGRVVYIDGRPIGLDGEPLTKNTIGQAIDQRKMTQWLWSFERQSACARKA